MWTSSELSKCEVTPSSSEDSGPSGARRALPLRSLRDGCCWAAAEGLQRTRGPHHVFITRQYFLLLPCGDSSRFHFSPTHTTPAPAADVLLAHASTPPPPLAPGCSVCVPRHWLLITTWMWTGGNGPAEGLDANRRQQDLQFKPADRPSTPTPRRHTHQRPRRTPSQNPPRHCRWLKTCIYGWREAHDTQMWTHTRPH